MIFQLAIRNLLRHKKNSLLLVLLISFITSIFFFGNSILSQSNRGLEQTYVDNLTADLMVQKKNEISMNLFGANTPVIDSFFTIPTLPAYNEVHTLIDELDLADSVSIVSTNVVMDVMGIRAAVPITGVETPSYFEVFQGIELKNGRILQPGEFGVMITEDRAKSIETQTGKTLQIGDPVKFTAASSTTFRIREVPLVGIYSYKNPGPYMDQIILMDPQTVRSLSSVLSTASEDVVVKDEALELLEDDLDDLFSDDSLDVIYDEQDFSLDELRSDLLKEDNVQISTSGGDWNFILLRVNEGLNISNVQKNLNELLDPYELVVVDWRTAAGNAALMVLLLQNFFYIGILLVSVAGGISIINIVLISVFRRTREIGTLRAIGASDLFISFMIILENLFLSLAAGVLGIVVTYLIILYINRLGIMLHNEFIISMLGQSQVIIKNQPLEAVRAVSLALFLGLFSSGYPCFKAININPIEAVRQG